MIVSIMIDFHETHSINSVDLVLLVIAVVVMVRFLYLSTTCMLSHSDVVISRELKTVGGRNNASDEEGGRDTL